MKIVSWNVRGLGSDIKRAAIKNTLRSVRVDLILLQETKVDNSMVRSLKPFRDAKHVFKPSIGAYGGILVLKEFTFLGES